MIERRYYYAIAYEGASREDGDICAGELHFEPIPGVEYFKVVELKPGERVISREELMQAFGQAYCSKENAHKVLDSEVGIEQARILFGDEK